MTALALDSDSKYVVGGFSNGCLMICEPKPKKVIQIEFVPAHSKSRTTFATFSADQKWLASGGADGNVKLWDVYSIARFQDDCENRKEGAAKPLYPQAKKTFLAQTGGVNCIAFSPDGKKIATCGKDGSVKVWNAETTKLLFSIAAHKGAAHFVMFSPDGELIASAGDDKSAKIWKAAAGTKPLHTLGNHQGPVLSVAFNLDGKKLATSSGVPKKSGQIVVWDVESGKEEYQLGDILGDAINTVTFHPKLARLASGGKDKKIRVWNTGTMKQIYSDEHAGELILVQFSGTGAKLGSICPEELKYWIGSPKVAE